MAKFGLTNLKLSQKGLILIGVPLVFEIFIVIVLTVLWHAADEARIQEIKSKAIIAKANTLITVLYNAGSSLVAYGISTQSSLFGQRFELSMQQIPREIKEFEALVADQKHLSEDIRRMRILGMQALQMMQVMKNKIDGQEEPDSLVAREPRKLIEPIINQFCSEIEKIIEDNKTYEKRFELERARRSKMLDISLFLAVLSNVGLAVLLWRFFNKTTNNRLEILVDNALRMTKKEALNAPLPGADEISYVDEVFHKMAIALAEAARKERAVMDNAVDVICSVDQDGKFTAANDAARAVFGYAVKDVLALNLQDLVRASDWPATRQALDAIRQNQKADSLENCINCPDGSEKDILWSIYWSDNENSYYCVAHDISAMKEVERLKQHFVAMLSHDLRTPLTSLEILLQLLHDGAYGELSDKGKERLGTSSEEITRLVGLINDLLDIEKLEAGKLDLAVEDISISKICTRAVESVRSFGERSGSTFQLPETQLRCLADPDRVVQVLVNLLSNAVKYSPRGSTIVVSAVPVDDFVEVRVSDQGKGIAPENLDAIFMRFRQVERADAIEKGGTGLGLAVCKAIVEQHGGAIGVTSELGKGSTFWFRLPQARI